VERKVEQRLLSHANNADPVPEVTDLKLYHFLSSMLLEKLNQEIPCARQELALNAAKVSR